MTLRDKMWDRILGTTDGEPPQQLKELIAQVWDEGYGAGRDDEAERRNHRNPLRTPNPYKETATK